MAATLCELATVIELKNAEMKLFHVSTSDAKFLNLLKRTEQILSEVQEWASGSAVMHNLVGQLMGKKVVTHTDVDVNISVASCICEILRIMSPYALNNDKQLKDFFELVVMTFEKLSSACDGCYTKMTKVLQTFSNFRTPYRLLHSQLDELVVRLFKQFLTVADSNSSAVVHEMEKIMTLIIEESKETLILKLVDLLVTSVRKDNQITSPVCYQLADKVIKICAAQLKPHLPDMAWDMEVKETSTYTAVNVQGYMVKNSFAPILEAILKKHGDIADDCLFKTDSARASFLEIVCEVASRIQTEDFSTIISEMEEIESQVSAVEAAKINVSWLRAHLEAIHKRKGAMKKSNLLMEMKTNTSLVNKAAQKDQKERYTELVAAQERFVAAQQRFEKAERCVKVLDIVQKKLNDNVLESKAEIVSHVRLLDLEAN